jgi:hypothetical protein
MRLFDNVLFNPFANRPVFFDARELRVLFVQHQ